MRWPKYWSFSFSIIPFKEIPGLISFRMDWLDLLAVQELEEVMEFQLSYFKSSKMMLWKSCTQYVSKFGKLSNGHRIVKGQFSFQSQRKTMLTKECSNDHTIALISHASKVMLKILQARLQQYVNRELPNAQTCLRKGRGNRDQIANIHWIIEKARVPEKHLFLLYWLCQSLWLCGSQ